MICSRVCGAVFVALLSLSCGGSKTEAASADSTAPSASDRSPADESESESASGGEEAESDDGEASAIPTECASKGDVCTPSRAYVEKLCQDVYPGVALVLFREGSPWTRGYLTRKTEAWNATGGASVSGWLEFDEEVLILEHRKVKAGGMQVSGAGGGYQALRWNGACVTLQGEEVTLNRPPQPKHAPIEWKWLEGAIRDAMKEDDAINETDRERRKECKGVTMGDVSDKCVKATNRLMDLVVKYVNGGGKLPVPEKRP
jgi:hypothetical protein